VLVVDRHAELLEEILTEDPNGTDAGTVVLQAGQGRYHDLEEHIFVAADLDARDLGVEGWAADTHARDRRVRPLWAVKRGFCSRYALSLSGFEADGMEEFVEVVDDPLI
jgi:hypothetical protein